MWTAQINIQPGGPEFIAMALMETILTFSNGGNKHMLSTSATSSADLHLCRHLKTLLSSFVDLTLSPMLHGCYNVYLKIRHMVQKLLGLTSKYVHLLNCQCHGLLILDVLMINQLWCSSRITIISTTTRFWRYGDQLILKFSKRTESSAQEKCRPCLFTRLFIVPFSFKPKKKKSVSCQKRFPCNGVISTEWNEGIRLFKKNDKSCSSLNYYQKC